MQNTVTKKIHQLISIVFQPLLMPTFGVLILMFSNLSFYYPQQWKWFALGGTFIFTTLIPLVPMLIMYGRGRIQDLFISKREDRTLPYMFALISYIFWNFFLWNVLKLPFFVVMMGAASTLSIIVIMFINLKWKISAHMAGIGGLAGAVFSYCAVMGVNPTWLLISLFIVSGLVALSRLELKAHTPGQIIAGYLVGFCIVFIPVVML